jgi:hypothetical protein
MSDRPDDEASEGGDTAHNEQGDSRGDQERSPPQAGETQGGQRREVSADDPQGGNRNRGDQRRQQQQTQTGPSIGDIFNRGDTMREIKAGVVLHAVLGVGIGLGMLGVTNSVSGGAGGFAGAVSLLSLVAIPIVVGVVGAVVASLRQNEELGDVANNLVYGTSAVTGFVGTIVTFIIAWILAGVSFDGVFGPMILGALGAAIAGAGTVWTHRGYLADTGRQSRQGEQYQQPQD